MQLREQLALDWAHLRGTAQEHLFRLKFLYLAGLTLFWPLAVLFLLAPIYGITLENRNYMLGFAGGVVALGLIGLHIADGTTDFLTAVLGREQRRRALLVYAACGAAPILLYLPAVLWAPAPLRAFTELLALALACSAALATAALWMLRDENRKLQFTAPWWCSRELFLLPALALPVLIDRPSILTFTIATVAFGVRGWVRRHEFMLAATRYAPVYWFAVLVIVLTGIATILAGRGLGLAALSAIMLGAIAWYRYDVFRFAYVLTGIVAALEATA